MKRLVLSALSAALLAGTAATVVAADPKPGRPHQAGQTYFDKLDTDKDGAVNRDEFMAAQTMRFQALDKNKDGAVSKDEYTVGNRNQERRAKWFEQMDTNKDGKVEKAEWDAAQEKHFAARDKNKDGKWTKDEKGHAQKYDKQHDKKPHGKKGEMPEKRS